MLADDVADNAGAVTRFVLLAPPGPPPPPTGHDRTTLAATTQNRPGSLLGLLTELAVRGIDLTRIESRPIKDRHAEYWFHLDCTGHIAEPAMGEALAALHRRCDRVRFLGSYPRARERERPALRASAPGGAEHGDATPRRSRPRERWLAGLRSGASRCEARARPARADRRRTSPTSSTPGRRVRRSTSSGCEQADGWPGGWPTGRSARCTPPARPARSRPPQPVAAAHGLEVEVVDGVHEMLVGDLEGRSDDAALEAFGDVYDAWWRGDLDARLPGRGVGAATCGPGSCLPSSGSADAARRDGDVVLVSHGAAIRLAAAALLGDTAETWYVPNTGLVVLRPDAAAAGRWSPGTRPSRCAGDVTAGGAPALTARVSPSRAGAGSSSSMPKWWATSCTTVTATSSTTSSSSAQTSRIASR